MKFSFSNKTDIQQTLNITVPSKEIDQKVLVKLQKAQKDSKIKGFRKGKAPMDVVTKIYGPEIRQDVIYDSVQHDFYHQIEDKDLRIVSRPNLIPESMDEGKDIKFKATFEVYPTVKVSNLNKLNYKKTTCDISSEDVEKSLKNIQKRMGKWEPVKESSESEDQIKINFVGKIDGEEFEGGSADDFLVELGSNSMIAGFEEGLVGLKAEDTKTLDLVFPKDYGKTELASRPVQFEITVIEVLKSSLPELNEEFFQSTGIEAKNIDDYKDQVKLKLEEDLKNVLKNKTKQSIFDALADGNSFEIPGAMIDSEVSNMRTDMARRMGMDPKEIDKNLFPESNFKDEATKRVKIGVLLNKIIDQKELKADPDKVKEIIEERAAGYKDPQQVINYFYSDEEQLKNIEGIALEEKVVDVLCSEAKAIEEVLSYEECISTNQMT